MNRWIVRPTLYLILLLLLLFISVVILLNIPYVQTKLVQKTTTYLEKRMGYEISIESVDISWFDEIELNNVTIRDNHQKEFIDVHQIVANFNLPSLFDKKTTVLDEVRLVHPDVKLTWYKGEEYINANLFGKALRRLLAKNRPEKKAPKPFVIRKVYIDNGYLSYNDLRKDSTSTPGFDPNYFAIQDINGGGSNLYLRSDTVKVTAQNLSVKEKNINFPLNIINTDFFYCSKSMFFDNTKAFAGQSYISDKIHFYYDDVSAMSSFIDSVSIEASLDSTTLSTQDLAFFAPALAKYHDQWNISADIHGKVNNFKAKNFQLYFGEKSYLKGIVDLDGLPDVLNTFIKFDFSGSQIYHKDIHQYLNEPKHIKAASKFGTVKLDAHFFGFPKQFNAYGDFDTGLGKLITDISFEIKEEEEFSAYSGSLVTEKFDLGRFLERDYLGKIDMRGHLREGSGFTVEDAKIVLDAAIDRIDIYKYPYSNIDINARLEKEFFNGELKTEDPNLAMNVNGTLDLKDNANRFDIRSDIHKAHLKELHITKDSGFVSSRINFDFTGLTLDEIEGSAMLNNTYIYHNGDSLSLDQFDFSSVKKEHSRTFDIRSNLIDFHAQGDFEFEHIYRDLKDLGYEYYLKFLNNTDREKAHYTEKGLKEHHDYQVDYSIRAHNANPILHLVVPGMHISKKTNLKGSFYSGKNTIFSLYTAFDSIRYDNIAFKSNEIDVHVSKLRDQSEFLSSIEISSDLLYLDTKPISERISFDGVWHKTDLDFAFNIKQYQKTNAAKLHGNLLFTPEKLNVQLNKRSNINLINRNWDIEPNNTIDIEPNEIIFDSLAISRGKEKVALNGIFSKNKSDKAVIDVSDFQLHNLATLLDIDMKGLLNAKVDLTEMYSNPTYKSKLITSGLSINDFELGDIKGKTSWEKQVNKLMMDVVLVRNNIDVLNLNGNVNTAEKGYPLDFTATLDSTEFKLLEPFLIDNASDFHGLGEGKVNISGPLQSPDFNGDIMIKNGGFTIDYLNTHYTFNDVITFDDDKIKADNVLLTDTLWNTDATLNGYLQHDLFSNFYVNTSIQLNNTFVLNTTAEDNDLYYGKAYGSGKIDILGPLSDLEIVSDELTTNKGTRIFIPLEGTDNIAEKNYIRFVSKEDENKEEGEDKSNKLDLSGITLNFNLDITPDAYFEIIFDKKAGDIIRGNGKGQMQMQIDTRGEFNMFGNFEIIDGTYNFTMVNLINKKFDIAENSIISWNGDPYQGELDIKAKYRQDASLTPLASFVDDTTFYNTHKSSFQRSYPVEITMGLTGVLTSPNISFDIDIQDYPNTLENIVTAYENRLRNNEQELNKQVFSLMVLKQFSPETFNPAVGGSVGGSVSELFSNQFSYWVSQFDENLEIDIDMSGFDAESNNTFRLKMSYSILDGRIRVTRDGSFTNVEDQQSLANVFGEWTIEYLMTEDGKLRMKAYNKTNQNVTPTSLNNATNSLYGVSLNYTRNFDNLSELFKSNPNTRQVDKPDTGDMKPEEDDELIKEEDDEDNDENKQEEDVPQDKSQ